MDAASLRKLKVDALKSLLRERGLPVGGKKQDLIDRLQKAQQASGGISIAAIPSMTIMELKNHLRSRGLLVGGAKQDLVDRLRVFETCAAEAALGSMASASSSSKVSAKAVPRRKAMTASAKLVKRVPAKKASPKKAAPKSRTQQLFSTGFAAPASKSSLFGELQSSSPSPGGGQSRFGQEPLGKLRLGYLMGNRDGLYVSVDPRAQKSSRVAAFDMDGTLIRTLSGSPFAVGGDDWQWLTPAVPAKLKEKSLEGYRIVVFSNQGGVAAGHTTLEQLEGKIEKMRSAAGVPICFLLALDRAFAKPNTTMFDYFDPCLNGGLTNRSASFFMGDMDGSSGPDSDRKFANAVCLPFLSVSDGFSVGSAPVSGSTSSPRSKGGVAAAKKYQIPHALGQPFCSSASDFALPKEVRVAPTKAPILPLAKVFECDNVQHFNVPTSLSAVAEVPSLNNSAPAVIGRSENRLDVSITELLRRSEGSVGTDERRIYWGGCEQLVDEGREELLTIVIDQADRILRDALTEADVITVCDALRFLEPPPFSLLPPLVALVKDDERQRCRLAALRALVELIDRLKKGKKDAEVKKSVTSDPSFFKVLIGRVAHVSSSGPAILGILDREEACVALQVLYFWCTYALSPEQANTIINFLTDRRLLTTAKLNELLMVLGPPLALCVPRGTSSSPVSTNARLMQRFVSLLVHENPEVERLAFRFFSNVTAGTEAETQAAIDVGIIREAVRCIRTHSCSCPSQGLVVDEAWFCLSNVAAGTAPQVARLAEFAEDILPLMIQQLENDTCLPVVKMDVLQTISNILAHKRMSGPGSSLDLHRLFCPPAILRAAAHLPASNRSFASLLDVEVLREAIDQDPGLRAAYGDLVSSG